MLDKALLSFPQFSSFYKEFFPPGPLIIGNRWWIKWLLSKCCQKLMNSLGVFFIFFVILDKSLKLCIDFLVCRSSFWGFFVLNATPRALQILASWPVFLNALGTGPQLSVEYPFWESTWKTKGFPESKSGMIPKTWALVQILCGSELGL